MSRTQLARHTEDIFDFHRCSSLPPLHLFLSHLFSPCMFCRHTERERFMCNKALHAYDTCHYSRVSNFVKAANNDGASPSPCKAHFSSDMGCRCLKRTSRVARRGWLCWTPSRSWARARRFAPAPSSALLAWKLSTWTLPAFWVCPSLRCTITGKKRKHTETLPGAPSSTFSEIYHTFLMQLTHLLS